MTRTDYILGALEESNKRNKDSIEKMEKGFTQQLERHREDMLMIAKEMKDVVTGHAKLDDEWQKRIEAEIQGHNDMIKIGKFLMKYLFPALGVLYPIVIFYVQMTVIFKIDPSQILQTLLSLNYEDLFLILN
jgi:hypothetical protein